MNSVLETRFLSNDMSYTLSCQDQYDPLSSSYPMSSMNENTENLTLQTVKSTPSVDDLLNPFAVEDDRLARKDSETETEGSLGGEVSFPFGMPDVQSTDSDFEEIAMPTSSLPFSSSSSSSSLLSAKPLSLMSASSSIIPSQSREMEEEIGAEVKVNTKTEMKPSFTIKTSSQEYFPDNDDDYLSPISSSQSKSKSKSSSRQYKRKCRNINRYKSTRRIWTQEEDAKLIQLVEKYNRRKWRLVAKGMLID